MNNIVTFETARTLKEAGFPQPDPEWGQFWYNKHGGIRSLTNSMVDQFQTDGYDLMIFAPTATDILIELPDYALAYDTETEEPYFYCFDTLRRNPVQYPSKHTNPAEACAAAYLEINKNPQP